MEFTTFYTLLTSILLLTAHVRSSVVPDSDQPQSCTTSCQGFPGPAGINGIPGTGGSPGNNGSPGRDGRDGINGRDGLKGDSGSKGDKGEVGFGEQGLLGPRGPSGERGELGLRGFPGKVGPGGSVGLPGYAGMKGDKGSTGRAGESGRLRESAFTVYKTGTQTASSSDKIVTFDLTRVDVGNHFDLTSNRFTCQIPGTYFFSFSVYVRAVGSPDVYIMMDGNRVAHARNNGVEHNQIGSSTVLEMEVGNQVWLQFEDASERMEGSDHGRCQFSGFLLYEH